jgi:hypothetical protein
VCERAVGPVGEDLLGLGVATVVFFGLGGLVGGAGEDGVIAPGVEQFALPWGLRSLTRRTISQAVIVCPLG